MGKFWLVIKMRFLAIILWKIKKYFITKKYLYGRIWIGSRKFRKKRNFGKLSIINRKYEKKNRREK
jgi:hypothetical protein